MISFHLIFDLFVFWCRQETQKESFGERGETKSGHKRYRFSYKNRKGYKE